MQYIIYGLVDPREGKIRYVGKTKDMKQRRKSHYSASSIFHRRNWYLTQWLLGMRVDGVTFEMRVLEITDSVNAGRIEQDWITKCLTDGCELFNQRIRDKIKYPYP